jgi:hypothetical protein
MTELPFKVCSSSIDPDFHSRGKFSISPNQQGNRARRLALADSRLYPIDHKARHSVEEFPKDLLGLCRQRSFPNSTIHQAHPSVAGSLIYMERRMPRAEAGMASLFDVSLRPSEPADQEISEAVLGTWKILRRVHRSQNVILRNLSIEGGNQACETFPANHRINFELLHVLCSPDRTVPLSVLDEVAEHRFPYLPWIRQAGSSTRKTERCR